MHYLNKPAPQTFLAHHGIKGQKWGMASEAKGVYKHFRDKGYDAIPDIHDRLSGTSETAMIVINPDKLQVTSSTVITKDVMKEAKEYVKSLEKLPVSELIKD